MVSIDRYADSRAELVKQVLTGVNKRVCSTQTAGKHILSCFFLLYCMWRVLKIPRINKVIFRTRLSCFLVLYFRRGDGLTDACPPPRAVGSRVRGGYCASLLCLSALTLMMKFLAE